MLEYLKIWTKNIVVIMMLGLVLEVFIPRGDLKRYVKMVMGLFVILVILQPLLKLANYNFNLATEIHIKNFPKKEEIIAKGNLLKQESERMAIENYKLNLENQIKKIVETYNGINNVRVNVDVYDDEKDKKYGLIRSIELILEIRETPPLKKTSIKQVERINIQISPDREKEYQKPSVKKTAMITNGLSEKIRKTLSDLYKIPPNNIRISIMKNEEG